MVTPARRVVSGLAVLLLMVVAFLFGTAVMSSSAQQTVSFPQQPPFGQTVPETATQEERQLASIYTQIAPSVVSINVIIGGTGGVQNDLGGGLQEGTGTGYVIDTNGHIVTNAHVVDGAQRIEVNFFDGRIVRGNIVGIDYDSDVAVISVEQPADSLTPIRFGNSDALFIGQEVLAIGSPFNQPWTMTTGIISALGRTIQGLNNFSIGSVIQTDAAINPGNSGGPLINLAGEVIGMNSQIISQTRSNTGIGFAIPANLVARIAQQLIQTGTVNYSFLGISGVSVNLDLIEALNLPSNARGVVVARVSSGTPAEAAGLRNPGNPRSVNGLQIPTSVDIITEIDGAPLRNMSDLIAYLANNTTPGQTVTLTVIRDGRDQITLPVTLSARPAQ